MNYTIKKPWAAWSVEATTGAYVGGYRIVYDKNFTFATVRGAGHMVPQASKSMARMRRVPVFSLRVSCCGSGVAPAPTHPPALTPPISQTRPEAAFTLMSNHIFGKGWN